MGGRLMGGRRGRGRAPATARPAIPVLLMLVYPGPAAAPGRPPGQRASDADRDFAADVLCAAVADGRLTLDELDGRLGTALSARTLNELAAVIADIPDRAPAPAPDPPTRWSHLQSLADRGRSEQRRTLCGRSPRGVG